MIMGSLRQKMLYHKDLLSADNKGELINERHKINEYNHYYREIKPGAANDWPEHLVFQYLEDNQEDFYSYWSKHFLLLVGQPKIDVNTYGGYNIGYNGVVYGDSYYRWCECPDCGWIGIEFDGRSDRLDCKQCSKCWRLQNYYVYIRKDGSIYAPDGLGNNRCEIHIDEWDHGCPRHGGNGDKEYNYDSPRLIEAYKRATQARFEYGESG